MFRSATLSGLLSLIGALAFPAGIPYASALTSCPSVPGDLNGNGAADVVDVQCSILAALTDLDTTGLTPVPNCLEDGMSSADQDCSDSISVVDISLCIQLSLGMPLDPAVDTDGDQCHNGCEDPTTSDPCDGVTCGLGEECVDGTCINTCLLYTSPSPRD